MKTLKILFVFVFVILGSSQAQEIVNLYSDKVPNAKVSGIKETYNSGMYRGVITPTLQVFLPEKGKGTGAAVVICPGGGYYVVVYDGEGVLTAKELAKNGIAAFVLKYRLPDDSLEMDKTIAPLQDAQQAIKVVRENAANWGVDVHKVGIMGFSAGGHLASTVATHFDKPVIENTNNTNLRPDFQILVYPVISMQDSLTHRDSRNCLLGKNPSKQMIDLYSNELQVTANTPPAYLTHAGDDKLVDVDNSIVYFEKLRHLKVPVEMHIYQKGDHGFIFKHQGWMEPLFRWMKDSGIN
ncbi:MAG TPA: alpha/beta hydrolase [Bacteroidales bacterium]|nr:alpha/beta hydrolase [Bacteroidales bacterium]